MKHETIDNINNTSIHWGTILSDLTHPNALGHAEKPFRWIHLLPWVPVGSAPPGRKLLLVRLHQYTQAIWGFAENLFAALEGNIAIKMSTMHVLLFVSRPLTSLPEVVGADNRLFNGHFSSRSRVSGRINAH
jgi:hypothetical protein